MQYRLTREFIQKQLDNDRIPWTDRQREMLEGIMAFSENVQGYWEASIQSTTNPGNPNPTAPPEGFIE